MSLFILEQRSKIIKEEASRLGFSLCGISNAEFLANESPKLEQWLKEGKHGKMAYMEAHFDKRLNPCLLVPDAKSVISLAYNYYSTLKNQDSDLPKISKYAYGEDYHFVVKDKLKTLLDTIRERIGDISGRAFVDSAPVLEKAWALKSGIGFMGKNTNIINEKKGSYFFLAELIIDLPLAPDISTTNRCGTCTRCIDACPTEALQAFSLNASKCISYYTIELKDEIPNEAKGKFENWIFGCDICQDICPWNRFSIAHKEPKFDPPSYLFNLSRKDWIDISEDLFNELFKKSPIKRTKFKGLKRNIDFLNL